MYKKELEKVPIFGYGLKRSPFIAVERTDARDAMRSIENALKIIRQNTSVIMFPEGTRSKDGELQKFKRGAFLLAARSGKKIVPLAIKGSNNVKKKGKWEFVNDKVYVEILKPEEALVDPDRQSETMLMNKVWDRLNEALKK